MKKIIASASTLEKLAKKLAEISANYTFGGKTLDEVISEFNINSELKIQIYEGMGKDIDIAHSISDIYDSCTIEAFVKILNNSKIMKKIAIINEINKINGDTLYWVEVDGQRIIDTITSNIDAVNRFYEYVKNNEITEKTIKTELKTEFI